MDEAGPAVEYDEVPGWMNYSDEMREGPRLTVQNQGVTALILDLLLCHEFGRPPVSAAEMVPQDP